MITPMKPGKFQMPDECLNLEEKVKFYQYWKDKYNWDGDDLNSELDKSGKIMYTLLMKLKLISNDVSSTRYVGSTLTDRRNYLFEKLKDAFKNNIQKTELSKSDKIKLLDAFIAIQYWGGAMGRMVIINNFKSVDLDGIEDLWINKFHDCYRNIVLKIISDKDFKLEKIENDSFKFKNFKISFLSKHLHFWSLIGNSNIRLPIYDSMVYDVLYAANIKQGQKNSHYDNYLNGLIKLSNNLGNKISVTDIEKAIFAYRKNVGVKANNILSADFFEQSETIKVNEFLNRRIEIKKVRTSKKIFKSEKINSNYVTEIINGKWKCSCKSFRYNINTYCKHINNLINSESSNGI